MSFPPLPCSAAAPHQGVPATTLLSTAAGDDPRAKPERLSGGGLLLARQLLKIAVAVPILISSAVTVENDGWSVAAGL